MKAENLIPEEENQNLNRQKFHNRCKIGFGIVVIAIGAILLTNEIHPELINTKFIWPVVIILFGLKMIFKSKHYSNRCAGRCKC